MYICARVCVCDCVHLLTYNYGSVDASYARSVAHRSSRPAHSELGMFGPLTVLTEHLSHSAEE